MAVAPAVVNFGRQIHQISGIQGVATGATATINMPTNRRYHRITLNTKSNSAVDDVSDVISTVKLVVNGITIRECSALNIIRSSILRGYIPKKGELPIWFTEPRHTNVNEPPDVLSWDLQGQSTFQIFVSIKSGLTAPELSGTMEFDFARNQLPSGKVFLQPVGVREYTLNAVAGENRINNIPFSHPIRSLLFKATNAGEIEKVVIEQDGNIVMEATYLQMVQAYRQYGFVFSDNELDSRTFAAGTSDATLAANSNLEARSYFDAAFLTDIDGRYWKVLRAAQSLDVRLTMTNAQAVTILAETMPGAFVS